ncbi:hypothetical protein Tco_1301696 [Tanacetum coccineum]
MEDSIRERSKESPHFKLFWILWLSLHATMHFSSLQMFQKSTCISCGILFTSMTLSTYSKWTKGIDSNAIWKSSEISSRSALEYRMHQPWKAFAGLINRSLSGKTTGLDKLRLSRSQILWGMYHQKNVDYVELLWEDFIYQIDNKAYKKQENIFVSTKEETQIYGAILPESLTSPEMKETKTYKTYLGFATGATPLKKARKFKKPASPKLTTVPVSTEEPMGKSKRVKRPAKKSTKAPARGVVIRETPKLPLSKKKEKVDVTRGKGIELLSEVALAKDTQFEEVRRKSMRDFHKTHPSGSGTITKTAPSAEIKPSVINEGTGVKPGVPDVTEDDSSESEAEYWGNDEDDRNNDHDSRSEGSDQERDSGDDKAQSDSEKGSDSKHETNENESNSESDQDKNEEDIEDDEDEVKDEFVKTPSNDSDDEDETKITNKAEGDEDEEMAYTTSQLYDDVDIRLNEPVDIDKGFVQEEGTDAAMTNVQQGNENPKILQVIEDAHVTLSTVPQKTEVPVTSSSHSSDLAEKFLNFLPVSVISDSSPVFSTVIPQSLPSFTPPPQQSTSTPPPTTEATNPLSTFPDFASVFQFNNRVATFKKEVVELKKDPLHTQVTALVDDHLDARLGATIDEFMNFLSGSLTARITEQVQNQLPQILPEEVSNFAPRAAATLTKFELKKILIDKIDKSESYLAASKHRECYEGLKKSYDLDKNIFSTYGKVYSLKRSRKDKDKDPSARSDQGLKKRKTGKDAAPTTGPKAKESQFGSSKGDKSQSKSFGKSVQSEEPEFEVADSDMPQDREENLGNDDEEPKEKVASKRDWFTKPTQPQEPTNPEWNVDKTPQQGQNQSWLITLATSAEKPLKTFDELMSTPTDFSAFIMNGLKINNLTQETLLGPAFRLLKGTRSNYAELEYDFEECYKALSEKLDWENPEGGDYPFDLTKPLPLVMNGNRQMVPVDYFFNNDLKYLQEGILTMTYTTSLTKIKVAQYDLQGIEDMVPNICVHVKVAYDKHALWGISHWREQRRGDFPRLRINDIEDMILLIVQNRLINLSGDDVFDFTIALRMFTRSLVIQKRNIRMEYLLKRRWSTLEKKRANIMIKAIDKQLKERRLMRSLEKFVGGRHYGTDLRLLQRTAANFKRTI